MIPETLPNVNELCSNDENAYFHVAQPLLQSSTNSVNVDRGEDTSPNTEPLPHSTTMNVPTLQSCYLCWRHAERIYTTTNFRWQGRYWPSEDRPLCRLHWLLALDVHIESVFVREQVSAEYERDERGQVA